MNPPSSSTVARSEQELRNSETRVRKGLRQDLYRPPRLLSRGRRAEDRNSDRLAAPACAAGQRSGRRRTGNSACCRRGALREQESVCGNSEECFTGEVFYRIPAVLFSKCNLRRIFCSRCNATSERRTVRASSALPGQNEEAGVLSGKSGKDSASRRPPLSDALVASPVGRAFCDGVTRTGCRSCPWR